MSDESAESPPSRRPSRLRRRRTILLILCVPLVLISIFVTTLKNGSTSNRLRTGSMLALDNAIAESVRLGGTPTSHVRINATISTVNDYWAHFLVAPSKPQYAASFPPQYGYAQFQHHDNAGIPNVQWVVITFGTNNVGCPTPVGVGSVPVAVIAGFGLHCPAV